MNHFQQISCKLWFYCLDVCLINFDTTVSQQKLQNKCDVVVTTVAEDWLWRFSADVPYCFLVGGWDLLEWNTINWKLNRNEMLPLQCIDQNQSNIDWLLYWSSRGYACELLKTDRNIVEILIKGCKRALLEQPTVSSIDFWLRCRPQVRARLDCVQYWLQSIDSSLPPVASCNETVLFVKN